MQGDWIKQEAIGDVMTDTDAQEDTFDAERNEDGDEGEITRKMEELVARKRMWLFQEKVRDFWLWTKK